jgi:hypothetical protein
MEMNKKIEALMEKYENIIFPSDEGSGIEHVDASYKAFMKMLRKDFENLAKPE